MILLNLWILILKKSPSGRGIRIIFKTNVKINTSTHYVMNANRKLEIYISDNTSKYVTLTGNVYKESRINDIDITSILDKYMQKNTAPVRAIVEINNDVVIDSDNRITSALENNPKFKKRLDKKQQRAVVELKVMMI